MSMQLTIIGLGQIGASIGLALANHGDQIYRTGSDIDGSVMQQAKKLGAVDKITANLYTAVKKADIVILALPQDQVHEMLEAIAPVLKSGAVLMDTAPVKVEVAKWMVELLPETCSYVGLTPVLNPSYLHGEAFGIAAAKSDLFQHGLFGVVTAPGSSQSGSVRLATDLIQFMGADPLFVDIHEIDGLMASTHILPELMSISLLMATLDKPGWNEARKVAGRPFAEIAGPAAHLDNAEALVEAAKLNRENVIRKLDDVITALQGLRQDIAQEDVKNLDIRIKQAKAGVAQWWLQRAGGNWLAEELPKSESPPTGAEVFGRMFGFGRRKKK